MSDNFDIVKFKEDLRKATNKNFIKELIINYGENHDLRKQKDRDKITRLGNYINFRTNFIQQQLNMIKHLIGENKKLKKICKDQHNRRQQRTRQQPVPMKQKQALTTNDVNKLPGHGLFIRTDGKPRSSRSRSNSSMYANPPKSPPPSPSLFTIQESQQQEQHRPVASSEKQRELLRRERRQFRVNHLNEPSQQVPNDLLEAFAKDDRENPFTIEKHKKQQEAMRERLSGKKKPKKSSSTTTTTTTAHKPPIKTSANIDYSNIIFGDQRRKRTRPQANSGSSGSSSNTPAKKKCTETYKAGDYVYVTAYGENIYRATISVVGPNVVMIGNQRVEIKDGQYLVKFDSGQWEVMGANWIRNGWYISKLTAKKSEETSVGGLDLNKMNIKF
jgi:hypothetical protein